MSYRSVRKIQSPPRTNLVIEPSQRGRCGKCRKNMGLKSSRPDWWVSLSVLRYGNFLTEGACAAQVLGAFNFPRLALSAYKSCPYCFWVGKVPRIGLASVRQVA